jgi:hypothetical protein
VTWVLAIPHFFVLFFLWIAFLVLSVVAFFAILFTGRYPRGIFDSSPACRGFGSLLRHDKSGGEPALGVLCVT